MRRSPGAADAVKPGVVGPAKNSTEWVINSPVNSATKVPSSLATPTRTGPSSIVSAQIVPACPTTCIKRPPTGRPASKRTFFLGPSVARFFRSAPRYESVQWSGCKTQHLRPR